MSCDIKLIIKEKTKKAALHNLEKMYLLLIEDIKRNKKECLSFSEGDGDDGIYHYFSVTKR